MQEIGHTKWRRHIFHSMWWRHV